MTSSQSVPTVDAEESARLLRLATRLSVATATVLIAAKGYAWWQTNSVAVLASLVDSLMDAGASLLNLFAVRYCGQRWRCGPHDWRVCE